MVLAILLFVKYIFFDKSEVFASSAPPAPSHTRNDSRSIKTSSSSTPGESASCPFDLSQVGNGSLTRHRTAPTLKMNVDLPKPVRRHGPPDDELEKVRNGSMVIMNGRDSHSADSATTNTQRRALEAPQGQSTNDNRESTDGGRIRRQVLKTEDRLSRSDFLLSKPTAATVSIGIQTDPLPDNSRTPRQSLFSIGGPGCDGRKDSVVSSPDSGIESGHLDVDTRNGGLIRTAEPRPIMECLNIFKSDVSIVRTNCTCVLYIYFLIYMYMHACTRTCTC